MGVDSVVVLVVVALAVAVVALEDLAEVFPAAAAHPEDFNAEWRLPDVERNTSAGNKRRLMIMSLADFSLQSVENVDDGA